MWLTKASQTPRHSREVGEVSRRVTCELQISVQNVNELLFLSIGIFVLRFTSVTTYTTPAPPPLSHRYPRDDPAGRSRVAVLGVCVHK